MFIHILYQRAYIYAEHRPGMTGLFPSLGPGLFALIKLR